jgi:CBS domain-containing protein
MNGSFPTVSAVMTRKVFAVGPDTSIESAARLLAQKRVSGAPVVSADGEIVGVVSLSDLVDPDREAGSEIGNAHYYLLERGVATEYGDPTIPRDGSVAEVMTQNVLAVAPQMTIVEAGQRMISLGVHRLLVVDEGRQLVGIVSLIDLVRGFVEVAGEVGGRVTS